MNNIDLSKQYIKYMAYVGMLVPALVYIVMVYRHAINIPSQDDYDAVLNFLCNFKNASFSDRIDLLFTQHNEHRILFSRAVCALHYIVFGDINFRHLILFNCLLLVAIFFLCVYFIRKCLPGKWHIAAIVLSLGLFDLNNFENANFALAGIFNYGMIFLFLLGVYFYNSPNKYAIIPAVLIQIISVYSGGNGIISTFFIVMFNVLNRDKWRMIISIGVFLITAPLYYYHYLSTNAVYFTSEISTVLRVFFNSLGGNFGIQIGYLMGIAFFMALIAVFPSFDKRFDFKANKTLPLICLGLFMMFSMLVMSAFRGKLPIEAAYSSRYLIYTHILYAIFCVLLFLKVSDGKSHFLFLTFSCLIYLLNFSGGASGFDNSLSTLRTTDYYYPVKEVAKQSADRACNEGVYCIEKHRLDK